MQTASLQIGQTLAPLAILNDGGYEDDDDDGDDDGDGEDDDDDDDKEGNSNLNRLLPSQFGQTLTSLATLNIRVFMAIQVLWLS